MKKLTSNIQLNSVAPFDNTMASLNKGYYICGGVCLVVGFMGGPILAVLAGFIGVFIWWVIKANIAQMSLRKLKTYTFKLDREVPYNELITRLTVALSSYGLSVDQRSDVSSEVRYKNVQIRIKYNEDGTFSMPWKINLGSLFFDQRYITRYKNTITAMSIIGYHVQQICSEKQELPTVSRNQVHTVTGGNICDTCGTALSDGAKFCPCCGNTVPVKETNDFCTSCGSPYQNGVKFCGNCGEKIN